VLYHNFLVCSDLSQKEDDVDVDYPFGEEPVVEIPSTNDMYDVLVLCGIFPSKSQARKNWKTTGKDIPPGWTELYSIGKMKVGIFIWNPIPKESGDEMSCM
jgi:hypothetical protein